MVVHTKTTLKPISEDKKASALTADERRHFDESIRHNHELLKLLAQL